MASQNPAKRGAAYVTYVSLASYANPKVMQANPTLAAGDVKVAIDDGAPANLTTLPVVDADFTKRVKVILSAAEMDGDNITVIFSDASGAEWCDLTVNIPTVANQFDDLATVAGILAGVVEGTKTLQEAVVDIWAATVGDTLADDADNPTSIAYDGPDGTVQVTHTLTGTTRAVS